MSSPVQNDLDRRSMYAPPWARETQQQTPESIIAAIEQLRQERAQAVLPPANDGPAADARARPDRSQHELPLSRTTDPNDIEAAMADAVRASWTSHPLDPVTMPEPPKPRLSVPSFAMVARLGGAVAVAAGVALFVSGVVPFPSINISLDADKGERAASAIAQAIGLRDARVSNPAPVAVTTAVVADASPTGALAVARLPPLAPAVVALPVKTPPVTPPLPAEVLSAFASIDATSTAPRGPKLEVPAIVVPLPRLEVSPALAHVPKLPEFRALDRDELAGLVKRGEMLLLQGDVSSARLLLRRAAEGGDANAMLMLAGTFDRVELARLKVIGIAPDDAQAKHWYAKAVEHGSAEAVRRLQQLAQR